MRPYRFSFMTVAAAWISARWPFMWLVITPSHSSSEISADGLNGIRPASRAPESVHGAELVDGLLHQRLAARDGRHSGAVEHGPAAPGHHSSVNASLHTLHRGAEGR